ncbi:hypothetical protein PMAYCL1PPCAC_25427, partial [Pristionchus mayeri]
QYVLNKSEKHLIQSKKIHIVTKLNFADQYKLTNLKNHCLNILHRSRNEAMKSSRNVPITSAEMLAKFAPEKPNPSIDYLAVYSPVFAAMFYGNFAEKEKKEVEIAGVIYEEFIDVLQLIHPQSLEITDSMVPHLLMLGDQFHMECVLTQTENYLIQSKGLDIAVKLLLAEHYRLATLKNHCYKLLRNDSCLVKEVKLSSEYANFSDDLKADIESTESSCAYIKTAVKSPESSFAFSSSTFATRYWNNDADSDEYMDTDEEMDAYEADSDEYLYSTDEEMDDSDEDNEEQDEEEEDEEMDEEEEEEMDEEEEE